MNIMVSRKSEKILPQGWKRQVVSENNVARPMPPAAGLFCLEPVAPFRDFVFLQPFGKNNILPSPIIPTTNIPWTEATSFLHRCLR